MKITLTLEDGTVKEFVELVSQETVSVEVPVIESEIVESEAPVEAPEEIAPTE